MVVGDVVGAPDGVVVGDADGAPVVGAPVVGPGVGFCVGVAVGDDVILMIRICRHRAAGCGEMWGCAIKWFGREVGFKSVEYRARWTILGGLTYVTSHKARCPGYRVEDCVEGGVHVWASVLADLGGGDAHTHTRTTSGANDSERKRF